MPGEPAAQRTHHRGESWASSPGARRSMIGNKGRDTAPELAIRRACHARGLRYRVNLRPIKGVRRTADMVFVRLRVAVFVDGCFWHACPEHATWPAANREFWREKLLGNQARDKQTDALLAEAGWMVVRIWEHERLDHAVLTIEAAVRTARGAT